MNKKQAKWLIDVFGTAQAVPKDIIDAMNMERQAVSAGRSEYSREGLVRDWETMKAWLKGGQLQWKIIGDWEVKPEPVGDNSLGLHGDFKYRVNPFVLDATVREVKVTHNGIDSDSIKTYWIGKIVYLHEGWATVVGDNGKTAKTFKLSDPTSKYHGITSNTEVTWEAV